jgi:Putative beta-barrel porin-2, OmpL-like. bbp2
MTSDPSVRPIVQLAARVVAAVLVAAGPALAQAPAAPVVAARPAAAQAPAVPDSAAKKPDAPPAPEHIETGILGIKLSGYVESAFNYSNNATDRAITGRLYERTSSQFSLNALKVSLDKPFDAAKLDAGFHADLIFGQNATVLQSTGFNLGPNGDVYQLYGTLNVPTPNGNGLQFKFGRMATFLGLELIETPLNPNLSIANQFIYAENFTQTGLSVEHRFNKYLDAQVRVLNGWDQVTDVNGSLSYMARLGIAPTATSSIAFAGYTGAEEPDNNSAKRTGVEVLASQKVGKVTLFVQGDAGKEARNGALPDSTRAATWSAVGAWLVIDATPTVGVALRGDYFNDANAFRTGGAFGLTGGVKHQLSSATATLNIKSFPNVMIRPELRFDKSNRDVFNAKKSQFTVGLGATYIF